MKAATVPSCNLPEEISEEKIRKRKERAERCTKRAVFGMKRPRIAEDTIEMSISVEKQQEHLDTQQELHQQESHSELHDDQVSATSILQSSVGSTTSDFGVSVKSGDLLPRFTDFITTNEELSTATGLETFDLLHFIVKIAGHVHPEKSDCKIKMSA